MSATRAVSRHGRPCALPQAAAGHTPLRRYASNSTDSAATLAVELDDARDVYRQATIPGGAHASTVVGRRRKRRRHGVERSPLLTTSLHTATYPAFPTGMLFQNTVAVPSHVPVRQALTSSGRSST